MLQAQQKRASHSRRDIQIRLSMQSTGSSDDLVTQKKGAQKYAPFCNLC
jgi:hypothetical protein